MGNSNPQIVFQIEEISNSSFENVLLWHRMYVNALTTIHSIFMCNGVCYNGDIWRGHMSEG